MTSAPRTWGERALCDLFGSEARAKLLAWLCGPPPAPTHLREMARRAGLAYTAARREVSRLENLGMVEAERIGRAKRYHLVERFPLLPGLRQIIRHAVGLVPRLRELLANESVDVAFIFGSMAAGTDQAGSDADLMVIGDIDSARLSEICSEAEKGTGREISPIAYRTTEFRQMLGEPSSFLSGVMRQPKIFVKGDENALQRLGK